MKKILIIIQILLVACTYIKAQTNVSGLISSNTTWTLANSPYTVTGNILVNNGATLTIEPGVIVKFDTLKALQVNGQLIARGTSSSYITFTSSKTVPAIGDWSYIFFSDASTDAAFDGGGNYTGGSILEYCIVQYAGSGTNSFGAVQLTGAHPFINYCTIKNNSISGIYASGLSAILKITNNSINNNSRYCTDGEGGAGIYVDGGIVTISNNTLTNNSSTYRGDGGGIYIKSGSPIITYNTIIDNFAAYNGGGIYDQSLGEVTIKNNTVIGNTSGIYTLWGTAVISNNIVYKNGQGIFIYYGGAIISNNVICNNTVSNWGGGIYDRSAPATISNNIISDNELSYDIYNNLGGGGINLSAYYTGMSVNITNNSIIRNSSENASAVDYNISYSGAYNENFSHNTITGNTSTGSAQTSTVRLFYPPIFNNNNIFNNTATYDLYNGNGNISPNLNGSNNWWGTTVDAIIQGKIYDWFDDATLGLVNYSPYLTSLDTTAPVSPPANVIKTNIGVGQIKLTWNHNPESDIAGYHVYYGSFSGYSFSNMIDIGNDTTYTISGVSINDTIGVTAYDKTYSLANENDSTIVIDNMTHGNESWFSFAATSLTGLGLNENAVPKNYELYQNYPNPFNPTTTINYSVPKASFVTIKVYDLFGRVIQTLVNDQKATGNYSVQFNANHLSSGVYFYRIQAGDFVQTRKLVLMK